MTDPVSKCPVCGGGDVSERKDMVFCVRCKRWYGKPKEPSE